MRLERKKYEDWNGNWKPGVRNTPTAKVERNAMGKLLYAEESLRAKGWTVFEEYSSLGMLIAINIPARREAVIADYKAMKIEYRESKEMGFIEAVRDRAWAEKQPLGCGFYKCRTCPLPCHPETDGVPKQCPIFGEMLTSEWSR